MITFFAVTEITDNFIDYDSNYKKRCLLQIFTVVKVYFYIHFNQFVSIQK